MSSMSISSDLSFEEEVCREFSFTEVEEDFEGETFDPGFVENSDEHDEDEEEIEFDDRAHQEVLTTEEVVKEMLECIEDVKSVTEFPNTTTRILLNHFRWDKERMMENFYGGDQEALFKDAHIINPFTATIKQRINESKTEYCDICFIQNPSMTGIQCEHRFCKACWEQYLTLKIMGEGNCESISCASSGCDILVDDAFVMNVLTDPQIRTKYQQLITNSFVQISPILRWCPSPGCSYAIKVSYNCAQSVTCKCGHVFCFECGEQCHEPVKCYTLRKWNKKNQDESENAKWITAHSKRCPNCDVFIEKNGGCNHMRCQNQRCGFQFCWVCLEKWPHKEGYYCNKIKDNKPTLDKIEKIKLALARYVHYYERYSNHTRSLKFEHKLYASVKEKIEKMMEWKCNMTWTEFQFLNEAVTVLCRCRQTLMYSYVFAFYLAKTNQSKIFEDNQADLETATENLSEYLEIDITLEECDDIKQKVQDLYRYCEKRRVVLLDHVNEGYDKDWWDDSYDD